MQKITAIPNKTKNGFMIPSETNRNTFLDWLKKYKAFHISPVIEESVKSRGFMEGAIIPAYCEWQYGIDPREVGRSEQRRFLFKRDFCNEVVNDRNGNPVKSPVSSKGKASYLGVVYNKYAEENGAPVPNPELYKLWKNKYAIDDRFPTFFDFLDFLGLTCDSMPSKFDIDKLGKDKEIEYPQEDIDPEKCPF